MLIYLLTAAIAWQAWSPQLFEQAEQQNKLVLLYLGAEWCAYCQKMEQSSWRDEQVIDLLNRYYIAAKIIDEEQPELAEQFRAYGRPALLFYDARGDLILHKLGYIKPLWLRWLLQGVWQDAQ